MQLARLAQQRRPHRAQHRRGRRDREAGRRPSRRASTTVGAPSSVERDERAERGGVDERRAGTSTRRWPNRSTSRPCTGAPTPDARRERRPPRRRRSRTSRSARAGRGSIASALMPIGKRASSVDGDQRAPRAATRRTSRVAPHAPQASSRARAQHARRIIAGVSLPVNVFCWLGWKQPSSVRAPGCSAPWPNRGRGRGAGPPSSARSAQRRLPRERAEADHHARRARAARPRARATSAQSSRSSGSGLLAGGAQRTAAVMQQSRSSSPSSRCDRRRLVREARAVQRGEQEVARAVAGEHRARCGCAPCAAGARPRSSTRAAGSPKPGIGRPQ